MTNILDKQFDVLQPEEITQTTDIQKALELINKEHIVTDPEDIKPLKKFVVEKNKDIQNIIDNAENDEIKTNAELDEIANQADQAFYDVMDMVVGNGMPTKGASEMASAAQSFLDIKLKSKIAKSELKIKRLKQQLDEKKLLSAGQDQTDNGDNFGTSDDDIIVIDRSKG